MSWARGFDVYRSFRAPTLNELFRESRGQCGDAGQPGYLRPERLFGAEAGVDYIGEMITMRVTAYRNAIDDIVTNVTLSTALNLTVRQRQNAVPRSAAAWNSIALRVGGSSAASSAICMPPPSFPTAATALDPAPPDDVAGDGGLGVAHSPPSGSAALQLEQAV